MAEHLYQKLSDYAQADYYPYHMPGHKRHMTGYPMEKLYQIDITEIDGFDNLHQPEDLFVSIKKRISKLYQSEDSFLLINGSTGGILSAISAVFHRGETILMARNCHKSVYHAVYLNGLQTEYVYPKAVENYGICGSIDPEDIRKKLEENPEIKGIFLTSPTYDGIVSDIVKIAELAHAKNIPVIVDEAHGAHFVLDDRFPKSAVLCGADIVINSIHKTLPAFTQTALLHVQGNLINYERLKRFLKIYQTSSPSYVLMAGIEQCITIMEQDARELCNQFFEQQQQFEKKVKKLQRIKVLSNHPKDNIEAFDFDAGKILISVKDEVISGKELYNRLLEAYHLQMEMAGQGYVVAIMTIMDTEEGFCRLAEALLEIDQELSVEKKVCEDSVGHEQKTSCEGTQDVYPIIYCKIEEAMEEEAKEITLEESEGCVSTEFVHIYPPGIPLIAPGEYYTKDIIQKLLYYREQGYTIEGMKNENKMVSVIRKEQNA